MQVSGSSGYSLRHGLESSGTVYIAPIEAMVREHAKQGGFPANRVSEVKRIIDPTSAEA